MAERNRTASRDALIMRPSIAALVILLMGLSCHAQPEERAERVHLYNGCLPVDIIVEVLSDDAKEIGLSREAIQNALESRLRGAHLYATPENFSETVKRARLLFPGRLLNVISFLYVRVSVIDRAFAITVAYRKWVTDEMSGVKTYATTWETGSVGNTNSAGHVMNSLAEHMDKFLVEFLRVNENDCQP